MQRSDKDKKADKNPKPASRLELKRRANRTRDREATALEQPTAPPSAIKIVDDRLEK